MASTEQILISGGWTALVGLAGFGAAIYNNRRTIKAARDDRLNDQRAALYVDTLRMVRFRRLLRDVNTHDLNPTVRLPGDAEQLLAGFQEPDWHELEARQLALASEPVFSRLQARARADFVCIDRFDIWRRDPTHENRTAAVAARVAAELADDALVDQVRDELQGIGKRLSKFDPPPAPPVRRAAEPEPGADNAGRPQQKGPVPPRES